MSDQMPEDVRQLLAEARLRRHGWDQFERGLRRSAVRQIRAMETPMPRYEVRTLPCRPDSLDSILGPQQTVHYIHDTVTDRPVPLSSTMEQQAADTLPQPQRPHLNPKEPPMPVPVFTPAPAGFVTTRPLAGGRVLVEGWAYNPRPFDGSLPRHEIAEHHIAADDTEAHTVIGEMTAFLQQPLT